MNMKRLMKYGEKALRLQMKRYPDKRFKDDDSTPISFDDMADQIAAILAVLYAADSGDLVVYMHGKNEWIVRRESGGGKSVRNNRHRNNRAE